MADNNNEKVDILTIQKYLSGVDYPLNKPNLLQYADDQGAPEEVLATLRTLPDANYDSPTDVMEALGGSR